MELGAPAYSFQYKTLVSGSQTSGSKTISGLNLNVEDNDDGITPTNFYNFMQSLLSKLGVAIDPQNVKIIENRMYVPE